jgi:hypothetical protein
MSSRDARGRRVATAGTIVFCDTIVEGSVNGFKCKESMSAEGRRLNRVISRNALRAV